MFWQILSSLTRSNSIKTLNLKEFGVDLVFFINFWKWEICKKKMMAWGRVRDVITQVFMCEMFWQILSLYKRRNAIKNPNWKEFDRYLVFFTNFWKWEICKKNDGLGSDSWRHYSSVYVWNILKNIELINKKECYQNPEFERVWLIFSILNKLVKMVKIWHWWFLWWSSRRHQQDTYKSNLLEIIESIKKT